MRLSPLLAERIKDQRWYVIKTKDGGYDIVLSIDGTYSERYMAEAALPAWREWLRDDLK